MKVLKTEQATSLIEELVQTTRYEPPYKAKNAGGMPPLPDGDEGWDFTEMLDCDLGVNDGD